MNKTIRRDEQNNSPRVIEFGGQTLVSDIAAAPRGMKTLVMVHRFAGYKLLLRMLGARLGTARVRGYGARPSYTDQLDEILGPILGARHDAAAALRAECKCALCQFNQPDTGVDVIVADAKARVVFCSSSSIL